MTPEHDRLAQITDDASGWRRWGPFVSDRAWGTVREDYSANGDAWSFLPHDLGRSKAYRWGEDAIAGWCDRYQRLVFGFGFWNGQDAILKERLFGLTSHEGNHGEDVKELYYHLDATPTHSYQRFLYKYPHRAFPYAELLTRNHPATGRRGEFEILDTGLFDEQRYFDLEIEYAKATEEDLCIRLTAWNRGPEPAELYVLAQLWFRNVWSWYEVELGRPIISARNGPFLTLQADDAKLEHREKLPEDYWLGPRFLYGPANGRCLFTDNETNGPHVFGNGARSRSAFTKDAFHRHLIQGEAAVNPAAKGTKAALLYHHPHVAAGGHVVLRFRFTPKPLKEPLADVDAVTAQRRREADQFYAALHPQESSLEEQLIQRRAWAGLLWSKQSYLFDVAAWQDGDRADWPPPHERKRHRNAHWRHLNSMRILTMPDKWEYPWFAAWDLAFQAAAFADIDPRYAKDQLWYLLFEQFLHPNGQIPAYEWEFSDLNPPVHAWAVWRVYRIESKRWLRQDVDFLEQCFHKLLLNFTWWVNRVDREGNNLFEGGFLGLDNITLVDRSDLHKSGYRLDQADATGWMGMYCLNMMRIALELTKRSRVYEALAVKFFQHYVYIANAMKHMGGRDEQLWDEEDGFFYDLLRLPDGRTQKFRVRSWVGLIPLFAVGEIKREWLNSYPQFSQCFDWFIKHRRELTQSVVHRHGDGDGETFLLTIVNEEQLDRVLARLGDPGEFLAPYGLRSLSLWHRDHPFHMDGGSVGYEPAEAVSKLKGGNSNWRGPVWFPTNYLLIESLRKMHRAFERKLVHVEGKPLSLAAFAEELSQRLLNLFRTGPDGLRPALGGERRYRDDPAWRDLLLFFEYFHPETGAGLGASHQTGWTALAARLIAASELELRQSNRPQGVASR